MDIVFSILKDVVLTLMSCATIAFAIIAFMNKRLVQAVLSFVQMVICFSVMLLLYKPIYVGVLYIIVYIGAVAVLFLFVLMLVNLREEAIESLKTTKRTTQSPVLWLAMVLFVVILNTNFLLDASILNVTSTDLNAWSSFATTNQVFSLFNSNVINYNNYLNFWSETAILKTNQVLLMLINLMTSASDVDYQTSVEFINNLAALTRDMGSNSLHDILNIVMVHLQKSLNTDLVYQFKALEDSTTIVSSLFTDKFSTVLFGSGSLLLLALIGSVYITKESA